MNENETLFGYPIVPVDPEDEPDWPDLPETLTLRSLDTEVVVVVDNLPPEIHAYFTKVFEETLRMLNERGTADLPDDD